MKCDRIDIDISSELQRNGRISDVEPAEIVDLSPSPCHMRVEKLQNAGYIEGHSGRVSANILGQICTIFTLKSHRQVDFARFVAAPEREEATMTWNLISGGLR